MSEQSKESAATAKGVAVVEEVPGTQNGGAMWRVLRDGVAYISDFRGDFQWCVVVSEYDGTWFSDRDIAEAVAAAINARESKPSLSDRIADADAASDAKVAARLAEDMGVTNELAAKVADAFRPFVDLQLKLALKKHRKELDERLNGMENDARESRQLVAGQINSIQRRIDRLKVIDPGHN